MTDSQTTRNSGSNLGCSVLPWALLLIIIGAGLPLHVCMPLWCDNHFYDVGARIILRGHLLYRELFYYVLPGTALLHAGVRAVAGWSPEALRGFDFLVALAVILLLSFGVIPGPRRHPVRVWLAALLLFFYFGTSEFCHCQPDLWMTLPALLALMLRIRQASDLVGPEIGAGSLARRALLEGVCWGLAFTIKPVVFLPGLACLLWTSFQAWMIDGRACGRRIAVDLGGVLAGGAIVGILLTAWLLASGNWSFLWANVTSGWLSDYRQVSAGWRARSSRALLLLAPWGFTHLAALPLAVVLALGARGSAVEATGTVASRGRASLGLLSICYLAWFFTAHFLQYQLDYHALPPILLSLAVLAGYALHAGKGRLWALAVAAFVLWTGLTHPLARPSRLALWHRCWTEGASASLRDALALKPRFNAAPSHVDLERVADYLRRQGVGDRELTCYSLSSLPLYTDLDLLPSTRFVQLTTMLAIARRQRDEVLQSVLSGPQRFVVVDLRDPPLTLNPRQRPVRLPPSVLELFPYREPVVFRSGNYLVHRVRLPEEPRFERLPGPLLIPRSIPDGDVL